MAYLDLSGLTRFLSNIKTWANDRFVDLTTTQTISGSKTFSQTITISDKARFTSSGNITKLADNDIMFICGGSTSEVTSGSQIVLRGVSSTLYPGCFTINTGKVSDYCALIGYPDGTFMWNGQNIQVSSDERIKTSLSEIPDEVLDAWSDVQWGQFKYLDAVERKGEDARLHLGMIAQRVKTAFEAHGLDACSYGILCHEVREARTFVADDGETIHEDAVDLWMVRYAEAQAMEAACQRRRADRAELRLAAVEQRLAVLEAKLS